MAKQEGLTEVYVHAFLDGRDVPPSSAAQYLQDWKMPFKRLAWGKVATISGRYYAMDRDRRWERTEKAYRALLGEGRTALSSSAAIQYAYSNGETDEFVIPTVIRRVVNQWEQSEITMRCSSLTSGLTGLASCPMSLWTKSLPVLTGASKLNVHFATMTQYDMNQGPLCLCTAGLEQYLRRIPVQVGQDAAAHRRNGEVRPRDLLL